MIVVVDTNVAAYALLRTEPFVKEVMDFWASGPLAHAPASWEAELVNVVWMATRAGVIGIDAAVEKLRLAESLGIRSHPVTGIWEGALARAARSGHPAHDTLFVELAVRLRAPLVTFDEGILRRFPEVAMQPRDVGNRA